MRKRALRSSLSSLQRASSANPQQPWWRRVWDTRAVRVVAILAIIVLLIAYGISIATFKIFPYSVLQRGYSFIAFREYTEHTADTHFMTDVASLITVRSIDEVDARREALIDTVWQGRGFPSDVPVAHALSASVYSSPHVSRVEGFTVTMDYGVAVDVMVLHPHMSNGAAVIYASGHEGDTPLLGRPELVDSLLEEGFTVALVGMPLIGDNTKPIVTIPGVGTVQLTFHEQLSYLRNDSLSPFKFFIEPYALTTNYLAQNHKTIAMTGLSGGGWGTTVYAAIDPRIEHSYPVAGSLPVYLRTQRRDWGDYEQYEPELYTVASYLDLYVMGTSNGRSQLQILNRYDSCCYAGKDAHTYVPAVTEAANAVNGTFAFYNDDTTTVHQISSAARDRIVSDLLKVYADSSKRVANN